MRRLVAPAWVLSWVLARGAVAQADGVGVIAVGADRGDVARAVAAASGARADDAVAVARLTLAGGAVPRDELVAFRHVRELVAEGWGAYQRVAFDIAAQRLATARTLAEPLVALPGGAEVYADAALRLGIVLQGLRRADEGRAVIALALALDPDRPIAASEFAPEVLDLVAAVRGEVRPRVRLRVDAPRGATVSVDGAAAVAAGTVEVTRGQHVLIVRAPRKRAVVHGIALETDGTVALDLEVDAAATALGGADHAALVATALRYGELDAVILAAAVARRGGLSLLAQRCAGTPVRCTAAVEIGVPNRAGIAAAARVAWDAIARGELRYPPSVLSSRPDAVVATGRRCEICRSPWLWSGVGAAVVVGVVVTLVATSGSRPPPTVSLDPDAFHQ